MDKTEIMNKSLSEIRFTVDPVEQFRGVLLNAALLPGEVQPDGVDCRCPTAGHPEKKNGWYVMFQDGHGGAYQNHEGGGLQFWWATGESLTSADRERLQEQIAKQKAEREAKIAEVQQAATEKARQYLSGLAPATTENTCLERKGCKPCYGLKADGPDLIVPVYGPQTMLVSYQLIRPNGDKRFAPGCSVAGGYFPICPRGGRFTTDNRGFSDWPIVVCSICRNSACCVQCE